MDFNLQLSDLLSDYPAVTVPNIQQIITSKKEFAELASNITEAVPKPGTYYKHQRFILRYMNMTDRLLMVHDAGSGKTCSIISVTEYFRRLYDAGKSRFKRAFLLTKGKSTKLDIKNQIICKCTAGTYLTPMVVNATNEAARKGNISRELGKYYDISTYRKFVNMIVKPTTKSRVKEGEKIKTITKEHPPLSDEEIIKRFSDTIIFVDEVHNLRGDAQLTGDEDEEEIERKNTEANVMRQVYNILFRIFHLVPRCKIILASATPMINSASEIGPIMNLILPLNNQIPPDFNYTDATTEQLEPYFRGRISYVRGLDTGAVPIYQGQRINADYEYNGVEVESQTIVYATQMNPQVQLQGYQQAEAKKTVDFRSAERQATCFVFPDFSYGGNFPRAKKTTGEISGIGKYIESPSPDRYVISPEIRPWISNPEYLSLLSCKYARIIELITAERGGTSFCYSDFMTGSGAIMLAMCFEAMGYQRYDETQSMFTTNATTLAPVCGSGTGVTDRVARLAPVLRYALLTSETSDAKQHSMMEAFNSSENKHGDYIKVLIGSPVTRDGINLSHVVQVHIVTPAWHQSGMYQALSRALRATSHVDLIEEARAKAIAEGRDPARASVEVKIYKHAAITPEGSSVDLEMYQIAEMKDREIHHIFRIMKECAIDCQIHRERNIRPNDIDGSPTCDYENCNYPCVNSPPTEIDYTTYDVFYSDEVVDEVIGELKKIFQNTSSIKIIDLYDSLKQYRAKFIDMALQRIIDDKEILYDRYGYSSFVKEDKGTVFLVRDFPLTGNAQEHYPVSYYTDTNITILPLTLAQYLARLQADEQRVMVQELANIPVTDPRFNTIVDQFNIETKVKLLEQSLEQIVNGQPTDLANTIVNKFRQNIFIFREPIAEIEMFGLAIANRGKGRGRKPQKEGGGRQLAQLAKEVIERVEHTPETPAAEGDNVYLHNLYNQQETRVSYSVITRINKAGGKLRILKPSEHIGWRDVNDREQPVYNARIQQEFEFRKAPYEQYEVYGTIYPDGKFRIRDRTTETEETKEREKNRGKICDTWKKPQLIDLLWRFQIQPPIGTDEFVQRKDFIDFLSRLMPERVRELTQFTDDRLLFYYRWYKGITRKDLCEYLKNYFRENNLLLVVS